MGSVRIERVDGVAVVTLDRAVTNAIGPDLVVTLSRVLREVRDDEGARGMVLTGAGGKFFSIGFDIPHLIRLSREEFGEFYRGLNRVTVDLYTFPGPTAAAITGHAIAGGCILALGCDYRVIAEGRRLMGLNEIKLGVPIPYPGECMLYDLVGSRTARDVVEGGEFFPSADLLEMGLVDRVVPQDEVLPGSIDLVGSLASMPPAAFAAIKQDRVERVVARIEARLAEKEERFLDCWFSEDARSRLAEAMKKF